MTPSKRLSKDDWLVAGFQALAEGGPSLIKAEVLARRLGATKGSFYWHFADLPAFKQSMLSLWREKVAQESIAVVLQETDPKQRLIALAEAAVTPPPDAFGGRKIDPAMRAWALSDADVMSELLALDRARMDFVQQLLAEIGIDDPALTQVLYATYLGLDDLAAKHNPDIMLSMHRVVSLVLDQVKK